MMNNNPINRRDFLRLLGVGTAALMAAPHLMASTTKAERSLRFYNLHTGEKQNFTYWVNGQYIPEELAAINYILRDHRQNSQTTMDIRLLDTLHHMQQNLSHTKREVHVISGYRSPQTNALLHTGSSGVASKSMHIEGKAIDIRIPGIASRHIYNSAKSLQAGGVGYYAKSDFVHIDTGRVRSW